ncbi:MAG: hypothetical protein ACHQF2_11260, partial [Flavobacteriales bacterium]
MKKILLSSLLTMSCLPVVFSQTFVAGGPVEGTSSNLVRITASEYSPYEEHVFAGTFVGSVDVDYT